MYLDDVIEQLNELRGQHGNVRILLADQSSNRIFWGKFRIGHKVVYGQESNRAFFHKPNFDDKSISVAVFFREL